MGKKMKKILLASLILSLALWGLAGASNKAASPNDNPALTSSSNIPSGDIKPSDPPFALDCVVVCPTGATPEGEPDCFDGYDDATNGGCNSTPAIYGSIANGETICGTSGTYTTDSEARRDTDWFQFSCTELTQWTITVEAEFPIIAGIVVPGEDDPNDSCAVTYVRHTIQVDTCTVGTSDAYLDAGNFGYYWLFIAPQTGATVPCGATYWVTLSGSPPPSDQDWGLGQTAEIPNCGVSNFASLGDYDLQNLTYNWDGHGSANYGGSFVYGNSSSTMHIYYGDGVDNHHPSGTTALDMTDPYNPKSSYIDDGSFSYNLEVDYCGQGFTGDPTGSDNVFLHTFILSNTGGDPINGMYAGLYFDWDVPGATVGNDTLSLDRANNMIIQHNRDGAAYYLGLAAISGPAHTLFAVDQDSIIYPQVGWRADTLYKYMSIGGDVMRRDNILNGDMSSLISAGPFNLGVAQAETLVFAVIGGANVSDLQARAQAAGGYANTCLVPDLGCDYVVGDVNGSNTYNGLDITYGVSYFKGGNTPQCNLDCDCFANFCGDVNGSNTYNGLDITYGVSYFKGGSAPVNPPDCPPGG